ncbi:MAG: hypothetical protein LAKADJCE_00167 [Candidatus Argoarchaeum ethanivorans]|uniref:Uncharacterized protein n=1 Tax=Candidatus Argoarchaeum ethanivorans TaxID=2608793 RepID=A0A811T8A6_9EURY|nr:MAG: hypothetical protein LAKADJCE_00167 [Candidatus Argoarchaeum ethanivorans]
MHLKEVTQDFPEESTIEVDAEDGKLIFNKV